jgi:hypothetical protein
MRGSSAASSLIGYEQERTGRPSVRFAAGFFIKHHDLLGPVCGEIRTLPGNF